MRELTLNEIENVNGAVSQDGAISGNLGIIGIAVGISIGVLL